MNDDMKQLVPGDPCRVRPGGVFDTPEAAAHVRRMMRGELCDHRWKTKLVGDGSRERRVADVCIWCGAEKADE